MGIPLEYAFHTCYILQSRDWITILSVLEETQLQKLG
jgi:hypothetical protein